MGIFGNLWSGLQIAAGKKFTVIDQWGNYAGTGKRNYNSASEQLDAYKLVSWANVCTTTIAEDVASTDGWVVDRQNKPVNDKTLNKLFEEPNPGMDWYELKEISTIFLLLTGNSYLLKTYDNRFQEMKGQAAQLWVINPMLIQPKVTDKGIFAGYEIVHQNGKEFFEIKDIVHTKLPNPFNSYVGLGKIAANPTIYNLDREMHNFNWQFFNQGGQPATAIIGTLSPETRKELKDRFKKYQGAQNAHKMILLSKNVEIKSIGLSQRDMDYLNLYKITREEILGMFHMPPAKAGIFETASNFTAKEQDANYWDSAVDPMLRRFDRSWTRQIIKPFNPGAKYRFEDVIRRDLQLNTDLANKQSRDGYITLNEARELTGYEKSDDPAMDKAYIDLSRVPLDDVSFDDDDDEDDEAGLDINNTKGPDCDHDHDVKITRKQGQLLRLSRGTRKRTGEVIRREMRSFFKGQEGEVNRAFGVAFKIKTAEGIETKQDREPTKAEVDAFLRTVKKQIFGENADGKLRKSIKRGHTSVIVQAIEDVNGVMDTDVDPSTANPKVTAGIGRLARKVTRINDVTRDDIEAQIKQGVDNGESIGTLKKRVEHVYKKAKGFRAKMIARTESSAAYDQGSILSYKEAGVKFVDVIGCQCNVYPCNAMNIPIEEADELVFHPNHTGAIVPRF